MNTEKTNAKPIDNDKITMRKNRVTRYPNMIVNEKSVSGTTIICVFCLLIKKNILFLKKIVKTNWNHTEIVIIYSIEKNSMLAEAVYC